MAKVYLYIPLEGYGPMINPAIVECQVVGPTPNRLK
jgi:hypothetical protein